LKFTTTKSNLLHIVQTVYRPVQTKVTLPILGTILFKAENGYLSATSTDMDLTLQCKIPLSITQEGMACLPARQITDIIRRLPDTSIQIEHDPRVNIVKILYEDSFLNIRCFSPDQFPAFPKVAEDSFFKIPQGVLKDMIKQTIYTVSNDKTRLIFTGVLFEAMDQKIRLVATDTHRLSWRETTIETKQFENVVAPGNALIELNRIMRNNEEPVQVKIGKTHIIFEMEDSLVISKLLAGRFPSYRQIIPDKFTANLTANTSDLSEALSRAALLLDEDFPILHFTLDEKESIIALNTTSGLIKEKLKAIYQGESMEILFNARYLIESLRVLPTEEVIINFTGPLSAAIIKPSGRDDYLSLLLPARPKND